MPEYPPLVSRLLRQPDLLRSLLPKEPLDREERDRVQAVDDAELTGGLPIISTAALSLVRGGLLYALDALEPAHLFFQEVPGDLGAYWHGMLHRREGDFDNARYWFRRAGVLPFFARLHSLAAGHSALMARQSTWDPYLFTGECEQARHGAEETEGLPDLQRVEFDAVFNYSWRQALGIRA